MYFFVTTLSRAPCLYNDDHRRPRPLHDSPAGLRVFRALQISQMGRPVKGAREHQRRRDPRVAGEGADQAARRARHRRHAVLPDGVGHGPSLRQRARQPPLDRGQQRARSTGSASSTRTGSSASARCRSRPASARANAAEELERCVKEFGFVGCNLNPDPSGGFWTGPAARRRVVVSAVREARGAGRGGHDARLGDVQPGVPHDRLALPERRRHGLHAADGVARLQGFPEAAHRHRRTAAATCPTRRRGTGRCAS